MKEITEIYHEAFGTFPGFDEQFFAAFGDSVKTLNADGAVVSALFLLPCRIRGKKHFYVYAAATRKDMRKKGYMRKLLEKVKNECGAPLFLMPSGEELVSFYEKCGFYKARGVSENGDIKIRVTKKHEQLSLLCDNCPREFTLMFSYPAGDKSFEFPYTMP